MYIKNKVSNLFVPRTVNNNEEYLSNIAFHPSTIRKIHGQKPPGKWLLPSGQLDLTVNLKH
jgi:hypothetical protein